LRFARIKMAADEIPVLTEKLKYFTLDDGVATSKANWCRGMPFDGTLLGKENMIETTKRQAIFLYEMQSHETLQTIDEKFS
jgi:hypothetical protein